MSLQKRVVKAARQMLALQRSRGRWRWNPMLLRDKFLSPIRARLNRPSSDRRGKVRDLFEIYLSRNAHRLSPLCPHDMTSHPNRECVKVGWFMIRTTACILVIRHQTQAFRLLLNHIGHLMMRQRC